MDATVIIVAYATHEIDLDWVPSAAPVIVVHNDDALEPASCRHPGIVHLHPGRNLGFGAGVNHALEHVTTSRVVLVNPDATLRPEHWLALDGTEDEVVTVPIVDRDGTSTIVVPPYWNPTTLLATIYRVGDRFAPLGSPQRRAAGRVIGFAGGNDGETGATASWPLSQRWVSGAIMSLPTDRLRAVGGFDDSFFLYFEDADLCQRLSEQFSEMRAVCRDTTPAVHTVGGSNTDGSTVVADIRRASGWAYAQRQDGPAWAVLRSMASRRAEAA